MRMMKRKPAMGLIVFGFLPFLLPGGVALSSAFNISAEGLPFKSEKPLSAKVALNEDGAKLLTVVFDESKGTSTSYDMLYADVNFNGRFEQAERVTTRVRKCSLGFHCDFPPIKVNVPYNGKAEGISDPCEVSFNYQKHSLPTRVPGAVPTTEEEFAASATIRLRQGTTLWTYSLRGKISPSEGSKNAPVWGFFRTPTIAITTRPDGQKKGNLGIGLALASAECQLECRKGGLPLEAHVEIKRPDGKVIHRGDATLDKFTFG